MIRSIIYLDDKTSFHKVKGFIGVGDIFTLLTIVHTIKVFWDP